MDKFCEDCDSRLQPKFIDGGFFKTCPCGRVYGRIIDIVDVSSISSRLQNEPRDYVLSSLFKKTFMFCDTCKKETENSVVVADFTDQKTVFLCHECVLGGETGAE